MKEGLDRLGDTLDAELARKERELAASPEERIDMILEEQAEEDSRFDALSERILGTDSDPGELQDEPDAPDESETD